jgi:hypothetical protein
LSTITKNIAGAGSISVNATPTEIIPDSLVIDMREEISMTDEDESQFTTFLQKAKHSTATREKINWREKDYFPRLVTVLTSYTNAATSIVLAANQGLRVRVGDVLRNMSSVAGDAYLVTAVATDTLTVVHIGVKAQQAGTAGDTMLITSNASAQGADFPETQYLAPTLGYNYTQIFRHGCIFSRTAKAVDYYGRSEPDQEEALKGIEHKRAIEYSAFWGARDVRPAPDPTGIAGGLVEYIVTNKSDVSASFTADDLDTFMRNALQHASRNVVLFVAPLMAQRISKMNRGGQGTAWRAEPQNIAGLKVDAFMSGVYGYEVPVVVKKDWNDFPITLKQYGTWGFLVDLNRVEYKTLTGGSTSLLENRQHPGADKKASEWLTECTWEIRNEASHGILFGVT